jgi:hypothetical protein
MANSARLTRRSLLAAAAAVAALEFRPARAQITAEPGCSIGFVNGLLQFSLDCPLLTPPALGMEVAPPSHLVSLAQAADSASGTTTEVPQSGSRRKRHAARQHQRRKFASNRRHHRVKLNRAARHRRHKRRNR